MLWTRAHRLYGRIEPARFDLAVFLLENARAGPVPADLSELRRSWDAPRRLLVAEFHPLDVAGARLRRLLDLSPDRGWSVAAKAGGPAHWWIQACALAEAGDRRETLENAVDHWRQLGPADWLAGGRCLSKESLQAIVLAP